MRQGVLVHALTYSSEYLYYESHGVLEDYTNIRLMDTMKPNIVQTLFQVVFLVFQFDSVMDWVRQFRKPRSCLLHLRSQRIVFELISSVATTLINVLQPTDG